MAEIGRCKFWRIEEHFEDRRYAEKKGALIVSERSQNFSGVEAVMQNNAAPDGEQRGHEYSEAAGVIHGRINLNPVTLPQLPGDDRVVGVPCDLPVRNHYALRPSGGAAGIEQAENILGLESGGERIWTNPIDSFGITQCVRNTVLRIQTY